MIDEVVKKISPYIQKSYFNRFFEWFIRKLDKLPSKAKADQLTCIDKARMLYKIGSVTDVFMQRLERRIMKNLDIKSSKVEERII